MVGTDITRPGIGAAIIVVAIIIPGAQLTHTRSALQLFTFSILKTREPIITYGLFGALQCLGSSVLRTIKRMLISQQQRSTRLSLNPLTSQSKTLKHEKINHTDIY